MTSIQSGPARAARVTAMGAAVYFPALALAQTDPEALADLIRRQAAQIERLESRLETLERSGPAPVVTDDAQAQAGASSAPAVAGHRQRPVSPPGSGAPITSDVEARLTALEDNSLQVSWASGAPKFSSTDGEFSFQPLGRIHYDYSTTGGSGFDAREIDGSQFRRARLGFQGQLGAPVLYKMEFDFADDRTRARDVFVATQHDFDGGQGVIYAGNKFADRSLDGASSSNYTWFLERNVVADAIIPESGYYNLGLAGAFYGQKDWHISASVNKGTLGDSNTDADNTTLLGRAHINPWATDRAIVHLGAWGFHEDFARTKLPSLTDNVRVASNFNDNVRIYSDRIDDPETSVGYGFELASLFGPLAASAEYGRRTIDTRNGEETDYDAYTAQIGYAITGEAIGYSTLNGVWSRPEIASPVEDGGWGAWQIMARYDALDYENSSDFAGGTGYATTLGLSWYLNRNTRFLLNYIDWTTHNRTPVAGAADSRPFTGADDGRTLAARALVFF